MSGATLPELLGATVRELEDVMKNDMMPGCPAAELERVRHYCTVHTVFVFRDRAVAEDAEYCAQQYCIQEYSTRYL